MSDGSGTDHYGHPWNHDELVAPSISDSPADAMRDALAELLELIERQTGHGRRGTGVWKQGCEDCAVCDRAVAALSRPEAKA
jgi:hypothetical protein